MPAERAPDGRPESGPRGLRAWYLRQFDGRWLLVCPGTGTVWPPGILRAECPRCGPEDICGAGCVCGVRAFTDERAFGALAADLSAEAPGRGLVAVGVVTGEGRRVATADGWRAASARVASLWVVLPGLADGGAMAPHVAGSLERVRRAYGVPTRVVGRLEDALRQAVHAAEPPGSLREQDRRPERRRVTGAEVEGTMSLHSERRAHPRLRHEMPVSFPGYGRARILDISAGGILVTGEGLPAMDTLLLELELAGIGTHTVRAEVVRRVRTPDGGEHLAARFAEVASGGSREAIHAFLESRMGDEQMHRV